MKTKLSLLFLIILFCTINNAACYRNPGKPGLEIRKGSMPAQAVQEEKVDSTRDLQIVRERVIDELLEPQTDEQSIENLMNSIKTDGSWPDINYEDTSNTGFEHSRHLGNMVDLSRAYKKPGSAYHKDPLLKKVIYSALDFWLNHDFICENWWWNQIGTPERMVHILLIMDDALTKEQRIKAAPIAERANLSAWGARPGGDLIKIAGILGKFGLYKKDVNIVEKVVETMAGEIMFASDRGNPSDTRGLQYDLSFHHRHDRVTNTLSYGLGYAHSFAEWAALLSGTSFSFPEKSIKLLVDFYLDGICKTMVYGKYPDPGAKNRSITRKGTLNPAGPEIPANLLQATSYRNDELKAIAAIRKGRQLPEITFTRFYWHSEYLSHQRPHYFTSVRMYSTRNHNMEQPYNGEGLKNHHLADGSNFISRTGKEYMDIFPVFDWQKIPGTTVVQKPALPPEDEIQRKGPTSFVGAITDGTCGAATFDFKSPHDSLKAKKSWFLFDNEYVSLGSGINSDMAYPVVTTLNQCLLNPNVVVSQDNIISVLQEGDHNLKATNWLFHDSIAYLFPSATGVRLFNGQASGSWKSINRQSHNTDKEVMRKIFKLWLDHGTRPRNATYEYIVVPGIGLEDIEKYRRQSGIEILVNSPEMQSVRHKGSGITQIVFHKAGKIGFPEDYLLTIDTPGLIMVETGGSGIKKITVADPSRKLDLFHLTLTTRIHKQGEDFRAVWNEEKGYSDIYIDLPQDEYAGQSVIIEM